MPDPPSLKSAGIPWLRGEPRQCGDRAHRLIAPSMAPTGERRPSMACLRPIPAPSRLSPDGCPWLRRCQLCMPAEAMNTTTAKDVAARGFRPSGTWTYRARVLEQDAEPRGGRNPLAATAPARSEAVALAATAPARSEAVALAAAAPARSEAVALAAAAPARSEAFALAAADPCPSVRRTTTKKAGTPLPAFRGCGFPSPGYGKQATSSRSPSSFSASIRVGM